MKQQTAVEWLISNLQKSKDWQRVLNEVSQMSTVQIDLLEQAKAMEKEQIEDAFEQGIEDGYWHPENGYNKEYDSAEQYYNEIYGK